VWLLAISLVCDVEVPGLQTPPDVVEAAFALAAFADQGQGPQDGDEDKDDDNDETEAHFEWDEEEVTTPKELLELWGRAQRGERPISLRQLLEANKKLGGKQFNPAAPATHRQVPQGHQPGTVECYSHSWKQLASAGTGNKQAAHKPAGVAVPGRTVLENPA